MWLWLQIVIADCEIRWDEMRPDETGQRGKRGYRRKINRMSARTWQRNSHTQCNLQWMRSLSSRYKRKVTNQMLRMHGCADLVVVRDVGPWRTKSKRPNIKGSFKVVRKEKRREIGQRRAELDWSEWMSQRRQTSYVVAKWAEKLEVGEESLQ